MWVIVIIVCDKIAKIAEILTILWHDNDDDDDDDGEIYKQLWHFVLSQYATC